MISHSKASIDNKELLAINKLVNSGLLTSGNEKLQFQKEFSEYIGSDYVKLTTSGTMAFFLILRALNIQIGDEVLLPDYICKDVLGPVVALGATPILYDNRENSWLTSREEILSKVTSKTKVVLINHTFGFVFKEIEALFGSLNENISVVEDCCHTIISKENPLSQFTRKESVCCFYSFNATKLLASGEGGAISSSDKNFISKIEKINIGDNLSDLNCVIGRIQLKKIDSFVERRKHIAEIYINAFSHLLTKDFFDNAGIFFRFPILVNNNKTFWISKSIAYRKGVDSLLSENIDCKPLPNVNKVYQKTVSIPIYPDLSETDIKVIIDETKKIIQQ